MSPSGERAAGSLPARPRRDRATRPSPPSAPPPISTRWLRYAPLTSAAAPRALSLARRSLGSLPGPERAEPGKRLNALTTAINEAFERRSAELTAERDARVLVEEAVDVTVPGGARSRSAPAIRSRSWSTAWSTSSSRWVTRSPRDRRPSTAGSTSTP